MLTYKAGDMFKDGADILVNAVNCVGVMGAGIAAQFKARWPEYFRDYVRTCDAKVLKPGIVLLHRISPTQHAASFPTKDHWKNPSSLTSIHQGLTNLATVMRKHGLSSVAMPALGCGNGGLDWFDVKALIETWAQTNADLDIRVYEPGFDEKPLELPSF